MRPLIHTAAVAVALAALAGCGKPAADKDAKAPPAEAPAAAGANAAAVNAPATTPAPLVLTIQDHKFSPAEIVVPANTDVEITVINKDPLAEEFDSHKLHVEKVIAGGQTATVRLRPLAAGRYPFVGEYHEATAKGVVVVQ